MLLGAAALALVWANSPWNESYEALWHTQIALDVGSWSVSEDLRHWVNEGLMALFFFVVGLEIKRELVAGELRDRRAATLPIIAALGGMVLPALLYLAITAGTAGSQGWGIPMATDIAFAVGILALFGSRVSSGLRVLLLSLAIVDDIGAIIVIAVVYSSGVDLLALGVALALTIVVTQARRLGVENVVVYVILGFGVWCAMYQSGVHATIAGVVLGLLTPARPVAAAALVKEWSRETYTEPSASDLRALAVVARSGISVAERLQHALHPVTSLFVVPVFAFANAGVALEGASLEGPGASRVVLAIVVGLVVGKFLGVLGASWLAIRLGAATLPAGSSWRQLAGVAAVAGTGFTVSLFIAGLAFDSAGLESAAKIGILVGSAAAAMIGAVLLSITPKASEPVGS